MWVGILGSVWNPELSAIVPESPWNNAIRASANDRDLWKEELKDKASDFREVRRFVDTTPAGKGRQDRSRSAGRRKCW